MKFKSIFIIFNIIIVFSFLFIFSMPLFLYNSLQFTTFLQNNWLILVFFVAILGGFNYYFIGNSKLFSLLEEENWSDLTKYIEENLYIKNIIKKTQVKVLLNTYLITSNTESTLMLEAFLRKKQPALVENFSLQFGIPYLLKKSPQESEKFFGRLMGAKGTKYKEWITWNYSLSLLQQNQVEPGKQELLNLLEMKKREPILTLLTIYILKSFCETHPEINEKVTREKEGIKAVYNPDTWNHYLKTRKANVQIVILSKIIGQATDWLFYDKEPEEAEEVQEAMAVVH